MVDERTGLTRAIGKTKKILRNTYGSTDERKKEVGGGVVIAGSKQKYRKLKFLRKLWRWRSEKKTKEELLEEGTNIEQNKVTLVTYALCFIMMLAGLSVKMN